MPNEIARVASSLALPLFSEDHEDNSRIGFKALNQLPVLHTRQVMRKSFPDTNFSSAGIGIQTVRTNNREVLTNCAPSIFDKRTTLLDGGPNTKGF